MPSWSWTWATRFAWVWWSTIRQGNLRTSAEREELWLQKQKRKILETWALGRKMGLKVIGMLSAAWGNYEVRKKEKDIFCGLTFFSLLAIFTHFLTTQGEQQQQLLSFNKRFPFLLAAVFGNHSTASFVSAGIFSQSGSQTAMKRSAYEQRSESKNGTRKRRSLSGQLSRV